MEPQKDSFTTDFAPPPRNTLGMVPRSRWPLTRPDVTCMRPETSSQLSDSIEQRSWVARLMRMTIFNACLSSIALHLTVIAALATVTVLITRPSQVVFTMESMESLKMIETDELKLSWEPDSLPETPMEDEMPILTLADLPDWLNEPDQEEKPLFERIASDQPLRLLAQNEGQLPATGTSRPGSMGQQGDAQFCGLDAHASEIVFLVDRSGSMAGARWNTARNELIAAIEALTPDQQYFVILFSASMHSMPCLAESDQLVPATPYNKQKTSEWLGKQTPAGNTEPLLAVKQALNMTPDTIFLLTDGEFPEWMVDYLITRSKVTSDSEPSKRPVIHTIAFDNPGESRSLQQIAAAFSGKHRSIPNGQQTPSP